MKIREAPILYQFYMYMYKMDLVMAHKCKSSWKLRIHLHTTISSCATIIVIYLSYWLCVSGKQLNVTSNAWRFCCCCLLHYRVQLTKPNTVHNSLAFKWNGDQCKSVAFKLFGHFDGQIVVGSGRKMSAFCKINILNDCIAIVVWLLPMIFGQWPPL